MQYKHCAQRMDIFNNLVKESSNIILKDRESADKSKNTCLNGRKTAVTCGYLKLQDKVG